MSGEALNSERTVEFIAINNYSRNVNTLNNFVQDKLTETKKLDTYLSQFRLSKDDNRKPNVTSPTGRFLIPQEASYDFFSMLNDCHSKKAVLHFRELQVTDYANKIGSGIMFDFDILQDNNVNTLKTSSLQDFTMSVMKTISNMLDADCVDTYVAIIAKPELEEKQKDVLWKNGIHMLIPNILLSREQKKMVIQEILNNENCNKDFYKVFKVSLAKAFDIQCASVPVYFLHNCKESSTNPYVLKELYTFRNGSNSNDLTTVREDQIIRLNQELSLTFKGSKMSKFYDFKAEFSQLLASKIKENNAFEEMVEETENVFSTANINADENLEYYKILVMDILDQSRAVDRQKWRDVIFVLANIGRGRISAFKAIAKLFSMRCPEKYNNEAFEEIWSQATDSNSERRLTMSSLIFWCKQDNQELYEKIEQGAIRMVIEKDVFGKHEIYDGTLFEGHFSYYLYHMFRQKFVCDYEGDRLVWYEFVLNNDEYTTGQLYKWRAEPKVNSLYLYLREKMTELISDVLKKATARIESLEDDKVIEYINERKKKLKMSAQKLQTAPFKDNIVKDAVALFNRRGFIDSLDEEQEIMGVGNGILVFENGVKLRQGYHEYKVSMFTTVNYYPFDIKKEASKIMLKAIMGMFPDNELDMFHYLMYFLATSLDNRPKDSMFLILQGTGSNGKSSLLEFTKSVLGNYGAKVNVSALTDQKRTAASSANEQLMVLRRARLAFYSETNKQEEINCAIVKEFTSQESITCRGIYQKQQTFRPKCNHVITTNHPPLIKTTDYGIWRRMKLYNFKMSFVPKSEFDESDPNMRIADESIAKQFANNKEVKEAFLGLLVEYHKDLYANHEGKLSNIQCASLERDSLEYRSQMDTMNNFIKEKIVYSKGSKVLLKEVVEAYLMYLSDTQGKNSNIQKNEIRFQLANSELSKYIRGAVCHDIRIYNDEDEDEQLAEGEYLLTGRVRKAKSMDSNNRFDPLGLNEWIKIAQ